MRHPRGEVIGGRATGAGVPLSGGAEFGVQRVSAGIYVITLPAGFKVQSAVASPNVAASAFMACTDYVDNKFTVRSYAWNTAATAGDCPFNFIAYGVQT